MDFFYYVSLSVTGRICAIVCMLSMSLPTPLWSVGFIFKHKVERHFEEKKNGNTLSSL